jgi:hypothetical protein
MKKLFLSFLLLLPAGAQADVPPPKGYVEQCTVEKAQKKGEFCTACGGAYHGDRDFCERRFAADKLPWEHRCKTRGASVWTEVWCTPWTQKDPPKLPPPAPRKAR